MIEKAILKLVWNIFIRGPLGLISAFNTVLKYLTGGIINDLLFGNKESFQWNNIPLQFWLFVLFAFCFFSLIFTIQITILIFKEAVETKTKFVIALQNGVKAFTFMFLIPIFFFLGNYLIQNIAETINSNFSKNGNLADYLWHMGDPNWNGSADGVKPGYGPPSNIRDYNLIAQLFGTYFMLFSVFLIGLALIQKIFELFFLFIISPIVMIAMVVDNGKSALTWKDMVIAKFLASTSTLVGYYIFIAAIQALLSNNLPGLAAGKFTKSLFIILALCGGGLATMSFSDMIASFIGESIGVKEGMASMKSTIRGGMAAMGAAKMTGKALKFMKGKISNKKKKSKSENNFADATINDNNNETSGINFSNFRSATVQSAKRTTIAGLAGVAGGIVAATIHNANKKSDLKAKKSIKLFKKSKKNEKKSEKKHKK